MNKKLSSILLVLLVVVGGCFLYDRYRVAPELPHDEITFVTDDGLQNLSDFQGENLIVVFYAKWCGQCLAEMQPLESLHQSEKGEQFRILALTDDNTELIQQVRSRFGTTFEMYPLERTLKEHDVYTIPTAYVINAKGETVFEHVGVLDWTDQSFIDSLIQNIQS